MTSDATSVYVSRFYEMDPQFEDVIFGADLRDGMVVLLEDHLLRGELDRMDEKYEMARVREANRWCTVTRLTRSGPLVRFIGLYGDDTKLVRSYHADYAWIVKKDSLAAAGGAA